MKKKGKFLKEEPQKSEKPKKNGNPMKVTAIVLSSLAAVLVLAAVGVGIFVWYSGSVRGAMFAARGKRFGHHSPVCGYPCRRFGNAGAY